MKKQFLPVCITQGQTHEKLDLSVLEPQFTSWRSSFCRTILFWQSWHISCTVLDLPFRCFGQNGWAANCTVAEAALSTPGF